MLGGNLQWTSIPSRVSRNTPSRFILQKLEISAGTDEPSGLLNYDWGQTLPFNQKIKRERIERCCRNTHKLSSQTNDKA